MNPTCIPEESVLGPTLFTLHLPSVICLFGEIQACARR